MAFISNKLIHWVGSHKSQLEQYKILTEEILMKKRLLYSPSPWTFHAKYGGMEIGAWKIPMICFTDIPLSEAPATFCMRYSHFGIAFEKPYLANCLACPVGYVQHPFIFQNFSDIVHTITGIAPLVDGKTIPQGRYEGRVVDTQNLYHKLLYMMCFSSNYSTAEFFYNEGGDDPLPRQEQHFESEDALYFEREWRMVVSSSGNPGWIVTCDGRSYFQLVMSKLKRNEVENCYR